LIFVNYGPESPVNSGDYYYRQFIHFKIPVSYQNTAYIRFYDLACGGEYDSRYGEACTEYEVVLFKDFIDENSFSSGLNSADVSNSQVLFSKIIGEDSEYLNTWKTFSTVGTNDGTIKNDYRYYSVSIRALNGNDANGFDVYLSSSEDSNVKIPGANIICFEPTFRLQKSAWRYTFRIKTDGEETAYNVRNFDFDNIDLGYSTFLKKYTTIYASDDGSWGSARFTLNKLEVGKDIGITLGPNYSSKIENDLVFSVQNSKNQKVEIIYPPEEYNSEKFPVVKPIIQYLDDCKSVEFRVDESTDPSNSQLDAIWFFEDGAEEKGLVVQKSFMTTGKFSPEVLLFNNTDYISKAVVVKVTITINKSPIAVAGSDKIAASGQMINFDASGSSDEDGRIVSYLWDFGDGNSATGTRVNHSYYNPGVYKVKLKIEDNFTSSPCRFAENSLTVFVNSKPIAVTESELIGATNEVLVFSAEGSSDTDGSIVEYIWDFGQFGKKEGKVITYSFAIPGTYKVKLLVRDNTSAQNNSDVKEVVVKINYPPISRPGKDMLVAIDEQIFFDGSNSSDKDGHIVDYDWNFGDGNTAKGASVPYGFTKSEVYKVTLTVTDNSQTSSASSSAEITVTVNEPPVSIAGEDKFLNSGYTSFDASSSFDSDGSISKYIWEFGDGKKAEGMKVTNSYLNPGIYEVKLTVVDNTKAKNNNSVSGLKVNVNAKPIALAGENITVAPNQKFILSAKNSYDPDGKILEFEWKLGENVLSREESFSHQFEREGIYQIDLTVRDNSVNKSSDYNSLTVTVNSAPKSVITAPNITIINSAVKFDASLSNDFEDEIKDYNWEFGDGTNASGKVVTKSFSKSGIYEVKLTVQDKQNVANSISLTQTSIFINSSPIARTATSIKTCERIITFDASSSADPNGDPITCYWDFYDGSPVKKGITVQHIFNEPGIYPVLLIVDDNHGLQNSRDSISISVEINATPIAIIGNDSTICTGDLLILNGLTSFDPEGGVLKYEWIFDDKSVLEGESISKVWKKSGVYQVTLKVTDNSGLPCNVSFDSKLITVIESPIADAGEDKIACVNSPVYFDGSKSTDIDGVVDAYEWDFGDGEFGSGVKPIHIYKSPGQYKVTLIITGNSNGRCDNKGYDELLVTVNEGPLAVFTSIDSIANGKIISFDASNSTAYDGSITSYDWDFGDGGTESGVRVDHSYKNSGNYLVKLNIKTDSKSDCNQTSVSKNIFINEIPIANSGLDQKVASGQEFILDASKSYDSDGNISEYKWDLGDGIIKYGRIVSHSFSKSGNYELILTVKDNTEISNNRNSDTLYVSVNEPPMVFIESSEKAYEGEIIIFDASKSYDKEDDLLTYSWYVNNQLLDKTSSELEHKFLFPGKYNIKLIVKDNSGFEENFSIVNRFVSIYAIPNLLLGFDTVICVKSNFVINPRLTSQTISTPQIEWYLNDELISNSTMLSHAFNEVGKFRLVAKLIDQEFSGNVLSSDTMFVNVNSPPKSIFISDKTEFIGTANDYILFDVGDNHENQNNNLTCTWDFGDKSIAAGNKVHHRYEKPGNYNVTLRIDDGKRTDCSLSFTRFRVTVKKY